MVATSAAQSVNEFAPRAGAGDVPRSATGSGSKDGWLCCGPLQLDLTGFSAAVDGQDVALTRAEFLLLAELVRRPYSTLTRERLVSVLPRAEPSSGEPPAAPRSMDVHIARLRAKLRGAGVDCIKTMRFVGYRFVPDRQGPSEKGTEC